MGALTAQTMLRRGSKRQLHGKLRTQDIATLADPFQRRAIGEAYSRVPAELVADARSNAGHPNKRRATGRRVSPANPIVEEEERHQLVTLIAQVNEPRQNAGNRRGAQLSGELKAVITGDDITDIRTVGLRSAERHLLARQQSRAADL